jgi:hypothetical protein
MKSSREETDHRPGPGGSSSRPSGQESIEQDKNMKRLQRLQSAKGWLQTYTGEPKELVKAYRKRYVVDWSTAFKELAILEVEIDPDYKEKVMESVRAEAENKRQKKAAREAPYLLIEEDGAEIEIPVRRSRGQDKRSKRDIPYDELDPNIVSLVQALNGYPAVITLGSCGGHENPTNPSQWDAGTWYVKFDIMPDRAGWYVLEFLAWAINEECRMLGGEDVVLLPVSAPSYLNTPGQCLHFVIEGRSGEDPDELAKFLVEVRKDLTRKR